MRSLSATARTSDSSLLEGNQRLGASGHRHELDLQAIRLVDLHDRPKIALSQTALREVSIEHDGVENLELHGLLAG